MALSWIVLSVVGAIPLWLSGEIPNFVDALFEIVSGFTTTGASIAENVEAFSHTALFWRSFSHWIGGMGVLVFVMAVVPAANDPAVSRWREYAYPASRKSGTDRIQTGAAYAKNSRNTVSHLPDNDYVRDHCFADQWAADI